MIPCLGDSLTYGHDDAGGLPPLHGASESRSDTPYPETLATLLGLPVLNLGFPGDTAAEGLRRWPDLAAHTRAVLMYGSNEALRSGPLTFPAYRRQHLDAMKRWLTRLPGALVLEAPPLEDPAADERLRQLGSLIQPLAGAAWVPTRPQLQGGIWIDTVHLTAATNRNLAQIVAERL